MCHIMCSKMLCVTILLCSLSILLSPACSKDLEEPDPEPPTVVEPGGPDGNGYKPGDASGIEKDILIPVDSATASENQPGEGVENALDGNYTSIYHSLWDRSRFPEEPVVIEFYFDDDIEYIDYMLYHPRKDGGTNGHILSGEILTKSQGEDYEKLTSFAFANSSATKRIIFPEGFQDPVAVKMVVTEGTNGFVSASQFEFFQMNSQAADFEDVFTDHSFSELRDGVSRADLEAIDNLFIRNMAVAIYDGDYEEERVGVYDTYPEPSVISDLNKTGRMGSYDNMTGIHVKWGEQLVVFVDEVEADMYLRVVNHYEGYGGQDFVLNPGANRITSPANGLVYLIYHSDNDHQARVNIASGSLNGYFDISRHTNEDWVSMITEASYGFFDLKGEKAHITFTTDELRQYVTDAVRLVEVYDSIVTLQQELMGLYKYDRVPRGRLYYRANTRDGVYMHATGNATEYAPGTLERIANHESLRSDAIWGPAHETGHIHQTRPGLMWVGMTEVTVNIYSQHVQTTFGNPSRLQTENIDGYASRYEKGFNEIIAEGIPHNAHGDVFVKLIPFWQLQLYYSKVHGRDEFYKDVHEQVRLNPDPADDGMCQLEFVKVVCDVAGEDLTGFFEAWGFLSPIDQDISDYGTRRMTITEEQVSELKDYIAERPYGNPSGMLRYITDSTVDLYRSGDRVKTGTGRREGNNFTMEGWENVVVFEVYSDDDLLYVSTEYSFTVPSLPEEVEVFAMGANGTRHRISL